MKNKGMSTKQTVRKMVLTSSTVSNTIINTSILSNCLWLVTRGAYPSLDSIVLITIARSSIDGFIRRWMPKYTFDVSHMTRMSAR